MNIPFEKIFEADLIHPLERKSLLECQKNPLYDWLANKSAALKNRLNDHAVAMLELFPVTKSTAPRLNLLYETALKRLDCRERYPLFMKFDYAIKFEVSGADLNSYVITISDVVDDLEDEEILALFGQALGRIKAGHVHNLQFLKILEEGVGALPLVGAGAQKLLLSTFAEWLIAAQFSMDRAAIFACGSERAVASLLMKQNGEPNLNLAKILSTPVERPQNLGIYFIWLIQSLPVFGAVERIRELRKWIRSDDFKRDYPGLYFRALLEDEEADEEDFPQLELHRAAAANNIKAVIALAEKYIDGEDVPPSRFMAQELFKAASFSGDARSMYIFAAMLENFSEGNAKIIRRLREVAALRGLDAAIKKCGELPQEQFDPAVEKVCNEFAALYENSTVCKTEFDSALRERLRSAFWMNPDEEIFAAELSFGAEDVLGTVLGASGIYGRLSPESLPFKFSWQELKQAGLYRRQLRDDKNYFTVGTEPIYCAGEYMRGTMAELLIRIALNIIG